MRLIIVQVVLLLVVCSFERVRSVICRDPTPLPRLVTDLLNESVAILPGEEGRILGELSDIDVSFIDITRQNLTNQPNTAARVCSVQSTCPWHFVKNIDPNRRPRTIIEAHCSTSCCRRSSESCCADGIRPGCSCCQPIYYYVYVLRRTGCDVVTRMFTYETKLGLWRVVLALKFLMPLVHKYQRCWLKNENSFCRFVYLYIIILYIHIINIVVLWKSYFNYLI